MKKSLLSLLILALGFNAFAQTTATKPKPKTPVKTTTTKPAAVKPIIFKTLLDSASYLIGVTQADILKQQGLKGLNTKLITTGCNEAIENKPSVFNQETVNGVMMRCLSKADSGKKPVPPSPRPVDPKAVFKNNMDSASYIVGYSIAVFYRNYDIQTLNADMLSKGFGDVLAKKPLALNMSTANEVITKLINQIYTDKAKTVIEEGTAFLAKNKLRPEVKTTASGLQYEILQEGSGAKPAAIDTFVAHYRGTLLDGTEFDASYNRGTPLTMPVGGVIRGWVEGLQLMSVGSKYKFYIPYELGYGLHGQGNIPGGAMLIFEVELLDIKKADGQ